MTLVVNTPLSMENNPIMEKSIIKNKSESTTEPKLDGEVAKLKGKVLREWLGVVKAEGRTSLLRELVMMGMGTVEVENFIRNQEKLRFGKSKGGGKQVRQRKCGQVNDNQVG